ncbi:hypothetical protein [Klebsiella aerogenes]|uniref:hypothetical protein n=1 Tax=Klebsiella aerogenes TaxID=548 RepID=UPI001BD06481|nr:hypothetical protein [Klebsiella aerogenes]
MRNTFLFSVLISSLCMTSALAYELPANALTYGMTSISNSAVDAPYGPPFASSEFVICKKNALTRGQADSCYSDEIDRKIAGINTLMNAIADSKSLPSNAKLNYINSVKVDLHRIDYLCDIFNIDENGKISKESNNEGITSTYLCRLNRLSLLKQNITQAVNEL